jgi:hypothetical protein
VSALVGERRERRALDCRATSSSRVTSACTLPKKKVPCSCSTDMRLEASCELSASLCRAVRNTLLRTTWPEK